ncbi:hypothetical protein PSPO01_00539 [Paraphaeosphaeria sporulosa]
MLAFLISISEVVRIELLDAPFAVMSLLSGVRDGRHSARRGALSKSSKDAMFPRKRAVLLSRVDHEIMVRQHHATSAPTAPLPSPLRVVNVAEET